jgi:MFS family permease
VSGSDEGGEPVERPYRTPWGRRAPDNPWWIAPIFGRVPDVTPRHVSLLGTVALALLFEQYDQAMLTAAASQIADSFGLRESDLASLFGRIQAGSLVAFFLVPFADRLGRRRVFLGSIVVLSLATVLSGFAQTVNQFIALQMVARMFMVTCSATAFVLVTEELPAEHRGWGIGILGALGTLGYGLALVAFAGIDLLPYGWRAMYVAGMLPLLLVPRLRRSVSETSRFAAHAAAMEGSPLAGWWRPLRGLVQEYPWRIVAVGLIGALHAGGQSTAFSYAAYFVQNEHGWSPGAYSAMAIAAGTFGVIGHPWTGRVADSRGRRVVGFTLMAAFPLFAFAFYLGPAFLIPLVWIPLIFSLTGSVTVCRALATELFPTSQRGSASGFLQLAEAVGRVGGFAVVDWGVPEGGSSVPWILGVSLLSLAAAFVVLAVPETGRRELEDISGTGDTTG